MIVFSADDHEPGDLVIEPAKFSKTGGALPCSYSLYMRSRRVTDRKSGTRSGLLLGDYHRYWHRFDNAELSQQ